jgi:predicted MFS family arabinose efflux permease
MQATSPEWNSHDTLEEQLNRPRVITLTIIIGSLLMMYWLVMPVVVGSLADSRGLGSDQLGLVASVFSGGFFLATFASMLWIRRVSWVWLVKLGSLGAMGGYALLLAEPGFPLLVVAHGVASFFSGIAYGVTMALIGDSRHPARNYALVFFVQVVLGMLANPLLPYFTEPAATMRLSAQCMIALCACCVLLAHLLPQRGCKNGAPTETTKLEAGIPNMWPVFAGLFAIVLIFTGDSGIWVFLERIGAEQFSREFGGTLVSINLVGGAVGSLSAAVLAERWGYWSPMLLAVFISLVSLLLFALFDSRSGLLLASLVNGWAWNFGSAYRMGLVARLDTSGRFTVLIPSMQTLGNTLGPLLMGALLVLGSYASAFITIGGLWLVALGIYYYAWLHLPEEDKDNA